MKKILSAAFVAATAAALLTGCASGPKLTKEVAEKGLSQVGVAYRDFAKGMSMAGAKLVLENEVDGVKVNYDYSLTTWNNRDYGEHQYATIDGELLKIEIPTFAELTALNNNDGFAAYTLTGAVTVGKEIVEQHWNIRITALEAKPVWEKIADQKAKKDGEVVVTSGYVTGFINNTNSTDYTEGVWIADGKDGMMLYGKGLSSSFGTISVGDLVFVVGKVSIYHDLFECKPDEVTLDLNTSRGVEAPVFTEMTEEGFGSFNLQNPGDPMVANGVTLVTDPATFPDDEKLKTDHLNIKFKLGAKEFKLNIHRNGDVEMKKAVRDFISANANGTFNLKGVLTFSYGEYKLQIIQLGDEAPLLDGVTLAA